MTSPTTLRIYRGFPHRLHHTVPAWVDAGALFHIRLRFDRSVQQRALIDEQLGPILLDSVRFYEAKMRWHITLFLLMPDHIHTILSFGRWEAMSSVISDWKRFHQKHQNVGWQEGFFDHRLRNDERGEQLSAKLDYNRRNPVVAGLCASPEEWPWKIDPYAEVGTDVGEDGPPASE